MSALFVDNQTKNFFCFRTYLDAHTLILALIPFERALDLFKNTFRETAYRRNAKFDNDNKNFFQIKNAKVDIRLTLKNNISQTDNIFLTM